MDSKFCILDSCPALNALKDVCNVKLENKMNKCTDIKLNWHRKFQPITSSLLNYISRGKSAKHHRYARHSSPQSKFVRMDSIPFIYQNIASIIIIKITKYVNKTNGRYKKE
jgi:hypothetical protein